MSEKRRRRQKFKKQLFTKNRLVILNEDSFEEIFSLRLTLMNVFVVATIGAIVIITFTTFIIAFTPLREYIPGYSSSKLKREALYLTIKTDSLERVVAKNEAYIQSVKQILTGDLEYASFNKDSLLSKETKPTSDLSIHANKAEIKLRETVAKEDKYNLFENTAAKINTMLFSPVKGIITEKFNPKEKHYAVDIALTQDTPIKSIDKGVILFADWTPTNGNIIIVRHNSGLVSVYKHAATITKKQGDVVRAGEVIALAGSTGKESTGIHLHFELWKEGHPVDPTQFIDFE
jgi:murein DD-endopeptidase MepM/ murein hydrolase activator NlpD